MGRGREGIRSQISLQPLSDGVADRSTGLAVEDFGRDNGHDMINLRFHEVGDALSSHGRPIGFLMTPDCMVLS
jgi:hypothetical protein